MYIPLNEGIDHINIYSKSKLELGRALSNFAHTPFTINGDNFESVEGYWYWLKTGEKYEQFKKLFGLAAKIEGKKFAQIECPNFNEKILEAIRCKLRQNKKILTALAESELPLAHYYYFGNIKEPKIYQLSQYQWIIDEFERIRKLMKTGVKTREK